MNAFLHRTSKRVLFVSAGVLLASFSAMAATDRAPDVAPTLPPEQAKAYQLAWHDEFDGQTLNTNDWTYRTDSKHWSTQLPANVSVGGGMLHIALKHETAGDKQYTGGGIITKQAFRYGYYEARFKCPRGAGWHTSFWMMQHNRSGGTSPATAMQEVDVCETNSADLHQFGANLHKWPAPHKAFGPIPVKTPDLSADFHVWGCEFRPDRVTFYFDGKSVGKLDPTSFPHGDQNIWLTVIASPLGNTKQVDDAALPMSADFDYVRFFRTVDAK